MTRKQMRYARPDVTRHDYDVGMGAGVPFTYVPYGDLDSTQRALVDEMVATNEPQVAELRRSWSGDPDGSPRGRGRAPASLRAVGRSVAHRISLLVRRWSY